MGYQLEGIQTTITSVTAATDLATMLHPSTGSLVPNNITIDVDEDVLDITAQGDTFGNYRPGLRSWRATIDCLYPKAAPTIGVNGLVTWSDTLYSYGIRSWTLDITTPVYDISNFSQSDKTWKLFRPSAKVEASGTFEAMADSATAAGLPHAYSASFPTLTLKLTEDGATDPNFAMSAFANQLGIAAPIGASALTMYRYGFRSKSAITATSGSGGLLAIFAAGAIGTPSWDTTNDGVPDVTLAGKFDNSGGSRTFSGTCFWSGVSISCTVEGLITARVSLQGAGPLTVA
jgi:hypothetical protein